jgi:threonine aldolase
VQVGILAAAGLYALDHQVDKLADDHKHAQNIAAIINTVGKNRFVVSQVDSNLVIVWVDPSLTTPSAVVVQLATGACTQVRALQFTSTELRLAFHCNITHQMAEAANKKVTQVIEKFLEH